MSKPSCANARANSSPMPAEPPVTKAVFVMRAPVYRDFPCGATSRVLACDARPHNVTACPDKLCRVLRVLSDKHWVDEQVLPGSQAERAQRCGCTRPGSDASKLALCEPSRARAASRCRQRQRVGPATAAARSGAQHRATRRCEQPVLSRHDCQAARRPGLMGTCVARSTRVVQPQHSGDRACALER